MLAGLGPQRTDVISLKTQAARANRSVRDVMKIRQREHHSRTVGVYCVIGTNSSTC